MLSIGIYKIKGKMERMEFRLGEALWKVKDRCDLVGNKASMMERRMEGLVMSKDDVIRHLTQYISDFRPDVAKDDYDGLVGPFDRWVSRTFQAWLEATLGSLVLF